MRIFSDAVASLALVAVGLITFAGCGGDSNSNGATPRQEACDVIGLTTKNAVQETNNTAIPLLRELSSFSSPDQPSQLFPKIINGTRCSSNNSPVVLLVNVKDGQAKSICTGTVIGDKAIVSAAHCFIGQSYDRVAVGSGDPVARVADSEAVVVNPNYRRDILEGAYINDVAIIKTRQSIGLPRRSILGSRTVSEGDIISIFGYGQREVGTSDAARASVGQLFSGQMQLNEVRQKVFLAEFTDEGSNTCFGDSGGPALLQLDSGEAVIAGVTSAGTASGCEQGDLSDFTRFDEPEVRNFIQENVPDVVLR